MAHQDCCPFSGLVNRAGCVFLLCARVLEPPANSRYSVLLLPPEARIGNHMTWIGEPDFLRSGAFPNEYPSSLLQSSR